MNERKPRSRPARVAVVTERCTGCSGAPVCRLACRQDALVLLPDPDNYPFCRMHVDPSRCTGCGACVSKGERGILLSGCPWDAIYLAPVLSKAPEGHRRAEQAPVSGLPAL